MIQSNATKSGAKLLTFLGQLAIARVWLLSALFGCVLTSLFFFRAVLLQEGSSATGTMILDREFGYSPDFAYDRLRQLSDVGRLLYAQTQLTLDMAFPAIYATLLASTLAILSRPLRTKWLWVTYLAGLPFMAAVADAIENVSIVLLIAYFPTRLDLVARLASFAGMVKHIFVYGSLGVVGILLLVLVVRWIKNRVTQNAS